ncbi:MAG: hypothetical protein A2007_00935 [Verrucomicrobia bacterium GWC2_42_7]|nr:MAG: hypothetical protein A2007_00935 [Verrucomicrobia bacterium GWC2_42_7]
MCSLCPPSRKKLELTSYSGTMDKVQKTFALPALLKNRTGVFLPLSFNENTFPINLKYLPYEK